MTTVWGEPLGKSRPRVTRHGTYTPKATREQEQRVQEAWGETHGDEPVDGESRYRLVTTFYRSTKHRRDIDNLVKLVMDALNGQPGAWADDHQVDRLYASVHWVPKAEARTQIHIEKV